MRLCKVLGASCLAGLGLSAAMLVGTAAWGQDAAADPNIVGPPATSTTAPGEAEYRQSIRYSPDGNLMIPVLTKRNSDADFNRQSEELVSKYGEAKQDQDREKIKAELADLLTKQFGIQQQLREDEVAEIEARVKKLRGLIEKRKAAQQSIIERRLDQLLREAEGLGWAPAGEAPNWQSIRAGAFPQAGRSVNVHYLPNIKHSP